MLRGLGRCYILWILWSDEYYVTAVVVSFDVLCYLVLLKAHLKISRLCKWALRRLKKGITELCWAARVAVVRGRLAQPRTVRGECCPFHKLIKQTIPWF